MNTSNIKKYAPKARNDFIAAMTKQAAKYGITDKSIEPVVEKGDLAVIGDSVFPSTVIKARASLAKKVEQLGFQQVIEQVAYSWFNRLCAIRYMELKGYLDHGRRVLSSADGSAGLPQILEDCLDIELPGLDLEKVRELKLDGTKDEALYRELLLGQCHALHQAMPFLFESVDDETELLLPENLTKTDSLIRELVDSIPEEDWQEVEVIGWLYQFYISEKKDQVMGKVVKSEDIPAATQLFTPNWIVKYLVQNSVGRQWLQTYQDSEIKSKMEYYIEPAEQSDEINQQLHTITPESIDPETIKVLDPACGSGHILIEAYNVLKAIYEERGFRSRDIPQLIIEKNLYGLDIDDRAGQLAGFALMMLAREDDRRIFSRNIRLNVLSLQESTNVNLPSLWQSLNLSGEWKSGTSQGLFEQEQQDLSAFKADNRYRLLQRTLESFKQAKTFGSLIEVSHEDCEGLKDLLITLIELEENGDSMQKTSAASLLPYVCQAFLLAQRYDAVVANPPYMGNRKMNKMLKDFVSNIYPTSKADMFSVFMERAFGLLKDSGFNSQINMQSWMFLSSYSGLREHLINLHTVESMAHFGPRAFSQISGEVVQTTAWTIRKSHITGYKAKYFRLLEGGEQQKNKDLLSRSNQHVVPSEVYRSIPGSPFAYWVSDTIRDAFDKYPALSTFAKPRQGLATSDNDRFLRLWYEVSLGNACLNAKSREEAKLSGKKWFPCQKGGGYRRWYGNHEYFVNWGDDGKELLDYAAKLYGSPTRTIKNIQFYFRDGLTWSTLSSAGMTMRYSPSGFISETKGAVCFFESESEKLKTLAVLNSNIVDPLILTMSPTLDFHEGPVGLIPINNNIDGSVISLSEECVSIAKDDWDSKETSWDFKKHPLASYKGDVENAFNNILERAKDDTDRIKKCEEKINEIVINSYGLSEEVDLHVSESAITLDNNIHFAYSNLSEELERCKAYRSDLFAEFISYSIGNMLGRYSLDVNGIVYAHSGNFNFSGLVKDGIYKAFPADDDAIIPLTGLEWFPDDATNRFREFVKIVWGEEHFQENLEFVSESLCLRAIKPKKSESSMDMIRRYLSTQFYKDHLKTYKKRPIYWLFSSGKQKAFECLVYLHRYNEGTLARMRTEYVIPLTSKLAAHVEKLEKDVEASSSASEIKRLEKEISQLHKQQAELAEFDEKLRHYADQRIKLDLDDGVKVNYGKFGDLLAEVKTVTGKKPEVA